MRRLVGTEDQLYEQVAAWLRLTHPDVPFHFDLAGVNNPSPRTRALYGRINKRAWPDLFIATPRHGSHGCFLELKKEGVRVNKRTGEWASEHIAEQAAVLQQLADIGYWADFAVGYGETIKALEAYLGAPKKSKEVF